MAKGTGNVSVNFDYDMGYLIGTIEFSVDDKETETSLRRTALTVTFMPGCGDVVKALRTIRSMKLDRNLHIAIDNVAVDPNVHFNYHKNRKVLWAKWLTAAESIYRTASGIHREMVTVQ